MRTFIIEEAIEHLRRRGLVDVPPGAERDSYRYAPYKPELGKVVDALARAYDEDRLGVMNLMNVNAIERVRNQALRTFAEAFVVGRKKNGDG